MAPRLLYLLCEDPAEEEMKMDARINQVTIAGLARINEQTTGEALHNAQYALLNELPGVVFGFLTLAWIVTSLMALS